MGKTFSRRHALKLGGLAAVAVTAPRLAAAAAETLPGASSAATSETAAYVEAFDYDKGQYTLPPLPYEYNALEPLYEERLLRLHHDKHHLAYVDGANAALASLVKARAAGDYAAISALSRKLAFNGSGHALHCLLWHSMVKGGSKPRGAFATAIDRAFGSFAAAGAQLAAASIAVEGSGWGVLAYEPISRRLVILQALKHQDETIWGVAPLLVCDVWEHAYYLQYENRRAEWVESFMKMANWAFASRLYAQIGGK